MMPALDSARHAPRPASAVGRWRPSLCAWLFIASVPGVSVADEVSNRPQLPQPDEAPLVIQPSPVGDIEYRPGRGLKVGETGLTLGGFTTVAAKRSEGARARFQLDAVDLFVFLDPTPYFRLFSDFSFDRLLDIDEFGQNDTTSSELTVERLYADVNVNDRINLRLGKFLTPVGRWNQVPAEPLVWTTSRPLVTDGPFDETVSGAAFWGSFFPRPGTLTYTLYGQFLDPLNPDRRNPPAENSAGARLEFSALGGWSVGTSYFAFSRGDRWDHLGGLDGAWKIDRVELTGEFLGGRGEPAGRGLFGLYLQGVVELMSRVYAVGRYEHFDPGSPAPALDLYDAGLAWRPLSPLILKADYRFSGRSSAAADPGIRSSISLLF